MSFKSTNNLDFLTETQSTRVLIDDGFDWKGFRIGTCHGLWCHDGLDYRILAVVNDESGNGHLQDVFDWFENSCKRDNSNLIIMEFTNPDFKSHVIRKRGFSEYEKANAIKYFRS